MGMLFLVELDQSDATRSFYMCRICRTHIALSQDYNYNYTLQSGVTGGLFDKVVNVQIDEPAQHREVAPHTVADVYCIKCGDHLGWKFVKVPADDPVVEKGMLQMQMGKLLMWDGNQIVDSETMEPVPDNP